MNELLARLRMSGRNPIRVRSTVSVNVYEWSLEEKTTGQSVSQSAARDVIDALRQGVVPEKHLDLLIIGQEAARVHLVGLLGHVKGAKSEFKFIRGSYGAGKTFLTSWLREQALLNDFAVTTVRIGPDQPLSDLPVFFAGLTNGLRIPEKREASALADIIESWLLTIHRKTAKIEGLSAFSPACREELLPLVRHNIDEALGRLNDLAPGFSPAIAAFYQARLSGNCELASTALAWIRGSRSLSAQTLHAIGVRGEFDGDQVFPRMRALLEIIAGSYLRGLLLIVDELELIRRFPHARQREEAYETLRLLVDEAGENSLPGCLLVLTGTDALFDDAQYGLASYEALTNRIMAPNAVDGLVSVRQPVLQLDGLDRERLTMMARKVRDIHGTAYAWEPTPRVTDVLLDRMVDVWTSFGEERVDRIPRPVLRELVNLLDLCEENPSLGPEEYLQASSRGGSGAASIVETLRF